MKLLLTSLLIVASLVYSSCSPAGLPPLGSAPDLASRKVSTTKPSLKRLTNGHYTVLEDWPVNVSGRKFIVQKDYTSNGITAPESIRKMLGDNIEAPETWTAVFHDWCYTQKDLTRTQCDDFYIQLMKDFNINARKIQLMGATVKGYSIYKGN